MANVIVNGAPIATASKSLDGPALISLAGAAPTSTVVVTSPWALLSDGSSSSTGGRVQNGQKIDLVDGMTITTVAAVAIAADPIADQAIKP